MATLMETLREGGLPDAPTEELFDTKYGILAMAWDVLDDINTLVTVRKFGMFVDYGRGTGREITLEGSLQKLETLEKAWEAVDALG